MNALRQLISFLLILNTRHTIALRCSLVVVTQNISSKTIEIPFSLTIIFIIFSPSIYGDIKSLFPAAHIKHIEGAGHWVHADKPVDLLYVIKDFLD